MRSTLPTALDLWRWFLRGLDFTCLNNTEGHIHDLNKVEFIKARTTLSFFQHVQYSAIFVAFILVVALLASYLIENVKFSFLPALPILTFILITPIYPGALSYTLEDMRFNGEAWRSRQQIYALKGYILIAAGLVIFLYNSHETAIFVTLVSWNLIFVLYAAAFSYSLRTLVYGSSLHVLFMVLAIRFVSWPSQKEFYIDHMYELLMLLFMSLAVSVAVALAFNWLARRSNQNELRLYEAADLLKSEKEYSDYIQDSLTSGLAVTDEFGQIRRTNPAFRRAFPDSSDVREIHGTHQDGNFQIEGALTKQISLISHSGREYLIDGKKFLRKKDEPGAIYIFTDVTEQREAERLNFQAQKMNAIGSMASRITHDFNNHLAVIQSNAEIIQSQIGSESTSADFIKTIIHSCESAAALTRHLLAYARSHPETLKEVAIMPTLARVKELLSTTLGDAYEIKINCECNFSVFVDRVMFESALLNLVVNSSGAMPAGGVIEIGAQIEDGMGKIYVSDHGEGIPPELLEEVKKPFFTTKPNESGTGLGLAAVVQFTERNDGRFELQSEVNKGTIATLWLHIHQNQAGDGVAAPASNLSSNTHMPKTILIVDDNIKLLESCRFQLEQHGHKTITAKSIKGIPKARETLETIDLVLCDVVLKHENAVDVLDVFRNQGLNTSFVFTSGNLPEKIHTELLNRGETAFLQKPVTINELIHFVDIA